MQTYPMVAHQGRSGVPVGAPNAALLIDFDNVTMGIRSDLTRQLKDLLNSDIIKGKVAVQRAYADWRRYAQYIVPLSEASVDLIFAPAYGSSKKNATDIRLAIDALELVFTRPEIGVFILLSGDSDFSSLVLKLKEYGKYVIGVGLRESASDLLVQNCDEYFSYSSLTGLTRAGEEEMVAGVDPWHLAERAVRQMAAQNDVMRSDRLKQVMLELDPSFDESQLGYSKFNRFLTEAASRNKLALRKLDNGQYEVQPLENGERGEPAKEDRRRGRGRREPRREEPRAEQPREERTAAAAPEPEPRRPAPRPATRERKAEDLRDGYELLQRAIGELISGGGGAARDSDIKRQMLEMEPGWDESALGFTKFSRFLRQAHDAEVIDLRKSGEGYYEATLPRGAGAAESSRTTRRDEREERGGRDRDGGRDRGRRGRERDRDRDREKEREPRAEQPSAAGGEREEERERKRPSRERAERPRAEAPAAEPAAAPEEEETVAAPEEVAGPAAEAQPDAEAPASRTRSAPEGKPSPRGFGRGARGRRGSDGPPPLLPGQVVGGSTGTADGSASAPVAEPDAAAPAKQVEVEAAGAESSGAASRESPAASDRKDVPERQPDTEVAVRHAPGAGADFDADELGLPTDSGSVIRYLSNSYPGVGQKTAETLIDTFGADRVFHGLHADADRVREILGSGRRTEALLEAWQKDYRRRTTAGAAGSPAQSGETAGRA